MAGSTGTSARRKKLTITACTVTDDKIQADSKSFEAMLNPPSIKIDFPISYDQTKTLGQNGAEPKFSAQDARQLSIELLLDGSGVVPGSAERGSVEDQTNDLRAVVYDFDGKQHEPAVVQVLWGSIVFYGRLTRMSLDRTSFGAEGQPMRAKVGLDFIEFMTGKEAALRANRSSPDLSHRITVRAGDTLPLLCQSIYKDGSYYMEVARHNGLTDFRHLSPGQVLAFPPLRRK